MKRLDALSNEELTLCKIVNSLEGTIEVKIKKLVEDDVFNAYRTIHAEYFRLFLVEEESCQKLEILKRIIFLNWFSMLEPSFLTGIDNLDTTVVIDSFSYLNNYMEVGKIDSEFRWMLSFYSSWDYILLGFANNSLEQLTAFVRDVDRSLFHVPKDLNREMMTNRGQMGIYWSSYIIEEKGLKESRK